MKLKKKTKQPRITIRKLGPIGKAFQAGGNEVLNNPKKYGLMPIPTQEEIEAWFTGGGNPDEKYWQAAPFTTVGDVFATVLNAFEYFKNRNIEKAQDNNSGE